MSMRALVASFVIALLIASLPVSVANGPREETGTYGVDAGHVIPDSECLVGPCQPDNRLLVQFDNVFFTEDAGSVSIEITDLTGAPVYAEYAFRDESGIETATGFFCGSLDPTQIPPLTETLQIGIRLKPEACHGLPTQGTVVARFYGA